MDWPTLDESGQIRIAVAGLANVGPLLGFRVLVQCFGFTVETAKMSQVETALFNIQIL